MEGETEVYNFGGGDAMSIEPQKEMSRSRGIEKTVDDGYVWGPKAKKILEMEGGRWLLMGETRMIQS